MNDSIKKVAVKDLPNCVVVVNDFPYINGGAAQVAIESAASLAGRGHRVIFFSGAGKPDNKLVNAGVEIMQTDQLDILSDPKRGRAIVQGIWNLQAAKRFKALLQSLSPKDSIVHIHGWPKVLSSSIMPQINKLNMNVVITVHDYFLACPNGGFFNYKTNTACKLNPLGFKCITTNCDSRHSVYKFWRVVRNLAQKKIAKMPGSFQNYIVLSKLSRAVIEPYLPTPCHIYEIGNPIDIEKMPLTLANRQNFYVYIGRLTLEKGPILAAEAARKAGVKLIIVGDGYLRSEIEKSYPEHTFTGWLTRDEVKRILLSSRGVIFPSLWYENQPLVVLESLAYGIPSIVADTCAARDFIEHNVTGLLFKGGDVNDLVKKLQMLKDDSLYQRLANSAYQKYWLDPFTTDVHVERLLACYADILARHEN